MQVIDILNIFIIPSLGEIYASEMKIVSKKNNPKKKSKKRSKKCLKNNLKNV